MSRLVPYLTLTTGVVASMFAFSYLPQLAVLVFANGPLAPFTTALLVLNESSTITNMVSRNWLLREALLDTFDGTLVARNASSTVQEGRELKPGSDPMQRLGRVLKSPFDRFSPKAIVRYIMYLPLNFIPIVGSAAFIFLQGSSYRLQQPRQLLIVHFRSDSRQDRPRSSESHLCLSRCLNHHNS